MPASFRGPRAFLLVFLVLVATSAAAVVGLNVIIDPFRRFDLVTLDGLNGQRPEFTSAARLAKAGVVCRMKPAKAILGTSRAELGLDPRHPGFRRMPGETYNVALAGSGLHELHLTLRHAKFASPELKQVVVALDFLMFNALREAVVFGTEVVNFDPERLLSSASDSCWRPFFRDLDLLLWAKGARYSLATIGGQLRGAETDDTVKQSNITRWIALYDALGYRGDTYAGMTVVAREKGYRHLVDGASRREAIQERYYSAKIWRPAPENRYCFSAGGIDTIETFRNIVQFGYSSGLDIRFVINPIHARLLFALSEIGLWPTYEEWKRTLVKALGEEAAKAQAAPYPLWDFSGFNTVTTEDIPPADDRQTMMKWFWEPSHYTSAAGDMMLDRALDHSEPGRGVPDDFGVRLDAASIEGWITRTREGLHRYVDTHPGEAAIVRDSLKPVLDTIEGANCGHDMQAVIAGSEALQRGDRDAAEAAFARAEAIHDAERRRYAELGAPFREMAFDGTLATARSGAVVERRLGGWIAYQTRGNERLSRGQFAGAVGDFSFAIRLGPPNPALHFLRGTTRMRLNDYKGAAEDFALGLEIDPQNQTLKSLRDQAIAGLQREGTDAAAAAEFQRQGDERRARGDLIGAISDYSEAIRVGPPNTALHFLRGTALLQVGDARAAATDFRAGLKLDPGNVTLKELLGRAQAGGDASRAGP